VKVTKEIHQTSGTDMILGFLIHFINNVGGIWRGCCNHC